MSDPAPPRGYGELSTIQVDQGAYRFAGYACRGEQPLEFATTDAAFAAGLLIGSSVIKAGDYAHGLRGLVRREHFDFALDPELAYFRWLSFLAHHEQRVLDGLGCDWCDAHRP
ncbi:MAG: hypothetical protein SFZ23_08745 [Planctomycetota bacterium]|nr:hypothetical protein [Planctomycetota bacterium]